MNELVELCHRQLKDLHYSNLGEHFVSLIETVASHPAWDEAVSKGSWHYVSGAVKEIVKHIRGLEGQSDDALPLRADSQPARIRLTFENERRSVRDRRQGWFIVLRINCVSNSDSLDVIGVTSSKELLTPRQCVNIASAEITSIIPTWDDLPELPEESIGFIGHHCLRNRKAHVGNVEKDMSAVERIINQVDRLYRDEVKARTRGSSGNSRDTLDSLRKELEAINNGLELTRQWLMRRASACKSGLELVEAEGELVSHLHFVQWRQGFFLS